MGTAAFARTAAMAAVFLGAGSLILGFLFIEANRLMTEQVLETVGSEAAILEGEARSGGLEALAKSLAARAGANGAGLYLLESADGRALAGNLERIPAGLDPGGGVFFYRKAPRAGEDGAGEERMAVARLVEIPGGRLVAGRDIERQRAFAARMRAVFLLGFGALSIAALAAGFAASRRLLRRVEAINAASRSIMEGDLSQRVPAGGEGDELDGLARNFNAALDRIEQLMAGLREVSDNIAHDLKTPLTRLHSRVEAALRGPAAVAAYRDGLEHALEEAGELIQTFNALLLIARLEAGAFEDSAGTFDLGDVVRGVAELYEPVAEERGLVIAIRAEDGLAAAANRQLIGQAVANLVDNAIKYAPTGGGDRGPAGRTISVEARRAGAVFEISVGDRGPGIAPSNRERAVKRFVRLDASRTPPGTGLGLSLVAAVARLHRGRLRLEDNAPGLRAVLELPARSVVK